MNYKEEQLQHLYKNTLTIRKLEQIKSHLGVTKDNNENGDQINVTKASVNFKEAKSKQQKRTRKKNRNKNNRQLSAYLLIILEDAKDLAETCFQNRNKSKFLNKKMVISHNT